MEILFATGNNHKKMELASLLSPHSIIIPKDKGIDFNPIENGKTFCENSLIKAKDLYLLTQMPVLADDSGLCIDALQGQPGIFSARYGGDISQDEKNRSLIEELNNYLIRQSLSIYDEKHRTCRFVCAMTLYLSLERFICIQEICEGVIVPSIEDAKGSDGFGYDPIVYLPNLKKTVAELSCDEKNTLSHRAKACQKIQAFL
ncbi:MAG: RdgB/HAM1 family non-canonical purine NTP pyrophosphatase [Treponemataceae bacterium]